MASLLHSALAEFIRHQTLCQAVRVAGHNGAGSRTQWYDLCSHGVVVQDDQKIKQKERQKERRKGNEREKETENGHERHSEGPGRKSSPYALELKRTEAGEQRAGRRKMQGEAGQAGRGQMSQQECRSLVVTSTGRREPRRFRMSECVCWGVGEGPIKLGF